MRAAYVDICNPGICPCPAILLYWHELGQDSPYAASENATGKPERKTEVAAPDISLFLFKARSSIHGNSDGMHSCVGYEGYAGHDPPTCPQKET